MKTCLHCDRPLEGREGKKFCDSLCRGAYHYDKSKQEKPSFYFTVQSKLKKNRHILKKYNPGGKTTVRQSLLLEEDFDPRFFTHYWKSTRGEVYLFVYEYGFKKIEENGRSKYVLIRWQSYMEKN